jgi:hypothetical protein
LENQNSTGEKPVWRSMWPMLIWHMTGTRSAVSILIVRAIRSFDVIIEFAAAYRIR